MKQLATLGPRGERQKGQSGDQKEAGQGNISPVPKQARASLVLLRAGRGAPEQDG